MTTCGLWFRVEQYARGPRTRQIGGDRPANAGFGSHGWPITGSMVDVDQQLTTVGASLARSDERMLTGRNAAGRVWKTGFGGLDPLIGGGMRAGSLILLAGPQGLGKSTFALQVARNNAATGRPVLYFSYEHDAEDMTQKLIAMEAGELDDSDQVRMNSIRVDLRRPLGELARPPARVGARPASRRWPRSRTTPRCSSCTARPAPAPTWPPSRPPSRRSASWPAPRRS